MGTPMQRVPPLSGSQDASKLMPRPTPPKPPDMNDEAAMRTLRELTEQVDAFTRQYPKTGKSAEVVKKALMAMMRDVISNPTQPGEAPAQRFG